MKLDYSIVLPVFNESATLEHAVAKIVSALAGLDAEIIIAEDGSTDGTYDAAKRLAKKFPSVRVLHSAEKLVRGRALAAAFKRARGRVVAYMDSDLSTDLASLKPLLACAKECDVVTGSRYLKESKLQRDRTRLAASTVFNFLVRLVLGSRLADHQCGFKAFSREAILKLSKLSQSTAWFWDTEILVLATKLGYCVREIPVKWKERNSGESKVRLPRDSLEMLREMLGLRLRLWTRGVLY